MKQNKILHIMPECFVDTNLIEYLLNAGVNHQHCCSKVVGQLNTTFADKFAIGIIDKFNLAISENAISLPKPNT